MGKQCKKWGHSPLARLQEEEGDRKLKKAFLGMIESV
jgi:hypothetical protein